MTPTFAHLCVWLPRVLGIAVALFIGMFALDAFSGGKPTAEAIRDFVIHLIPAAVLLLVVAVSWRYPWVGAAVFIACAALYAISVRRLDWIAAISGPLFLVGLLFLCAFVVSRRDAAATLRQIP